MTLLEQLIASTLWILLIWKKGEPLDAYARRQVKHLRQSIAVAPDPLLVMVAWIQSVQGGLRSGIDLRGVLERYPLRLAKDAEEASALTELIRTGLEQGMPMGEALASLKRNFALQAKGRRKARALTTQARLQGTVASFIPPGVGGAIFIVDPQFFLAADTRLQAASLVALAALLNTAGVLWMRSLVKNCFRPQNSLSGEIDEHLAPVLSLIIGRLSMGLDAERAFSESLATIPRARRLAKAMASDSLEERGQPEVLQQVLAAKGRAIALGAPVRSVLAEILEDFESAREARLEEIAQALPLKLLLPLFACIFPANLAILAVPALGALQIF